MLVAKFPGSMYATQATNAGPRNGRIREIPRLELRPSSTAPAPDFRLRSFAGPPIVLSAYRGNIVVLNFWASWCVPCREEMPNLERTWQEFRTQGVVVLGINVADDYDDAAVFLKKLAITYPSVFDPEQTRLRAYGVVGLPTTFFLDPRMQLRDKVPGGYVGPDGYQHLRREILGLLRL